MFKFEGTAMGKGGTVEFQILFGCFDMSPCCFGNQTDEIESSNSFCVE